MSLFFETSRQSRGFLLCVPIGFLIALGLCSGSGRGWIRFLLDSLVLLSGALGFLILFVLIQENGMRAYHVLGALSGALLYMLGFYRLWHGIARRMKGKLFRKSFLQAGKDGCETEMKKE